VAPGLRLSSAVECSLAARVEVTERISGQPGWRSAQKPTGSTRLRGDIRTTSVARAVINEPDDSRLLKDVMGGA
jgi:hypothetical protein